MSFIPPGRDCPLCPRLVAFREENRKRFPDWHNGPVSPFGSIEARLLVAGLAPGLRGANCTGRPFTGDWAGDLLYDTLLAHKLARGTYLERPDDGLELIDCRITNAVRCVPPANRPTPAEAKACRPFLSDELASMPNLQVVLAIGGFAHDQVITALGGKKSSFPFAHGAVHPVTPRVTMVDSYHCSRLNTNTGRLTAAMFAKVVQEAISQLR